MVATSMAVAGWVLLGVIGFYWVLLDSTGFYLVYRGFLLGFTGFYLVLPSFTVVFFYGGF